MYDPHKCLLFCVVPVVYCVHVPSRHPWFGRVPFFFLCKCTANPSKILWTGSKGVEAVLISFCSGPNAGYRGNRMLNSAERAVTTAINLRSFWHHKKLIIAQEDIIFCHVIASNYTHVTSLPLSVRQIRPDMVEYYRARAKRLINWLKQHVSLSRVILCQEVRESCSLYFYVIFLCNYLRRDFFFTQLYNIKYF